MSEPTSNNNPDDHNKGPKATIVLLSIPDGLKEKGVKNIIYARTFISIEYQDKIFNFTVHKQDITKTESLFDKELGNDVSNVIKQQIWVCISSNWLKHVYTEEEIRRDSLGAIGGQADAILDIAEQNCQEIFKDEYKTAHAAVTINDHLEILPIKSTRFKHWLRKTVRKEFDVIVRDGLLNEVIEDLSSNAVFDGQIRELSLRFASAPDDNLGLKLRWTYDLTNDDYEFIEITPEGWKTKKNEIIFRRIDHQQAQDYPNAAGDYPVDIFDQFMDLINVKPSKRLILKC